MSLAANYAAALETTKAIVAGVKEDQLSDPTTCPDMNVKGLLEHLTSSAQMFLEMAEGKPVASFPAPVTGDAAGAWVAMADKLGKAWAGHESFAKTVTMPFGEFPTEWALQLHTMEVLVHGWDLAKSTGQDTQLDPALAQAAYDFMAPQMDSMRASGSFGAGVDVPEGRPVGDRLVGMLGRKP